MGRHPRVLVTGATGQLGKALRPFFPDARFLGRSELDVRSPRDVKDAVAGSDVVIHCAAWTDVDGCEGNPPAAWGTNSLGTANVARAVDSTRARIVYVSTDYVFDGTKGSEYSEDDPVHPVNVYGETKLAGENHVLEQSRHLVVRTSWLFGAGKNFVNTILAAATARPHLHVVDDQYGRPTYAGDLAAAISEAVLQESSGVVHVAGDGRVCSWADFASAILTLTGSSARLHRVSTEVYAARAGKALAPRPQNTSLSLLRARSWGLALEQWHESLERYLKDSA